MAVHVYNFEKTLVADERRGAGAWGQRGDGGFEEGVGKGGERG